MKLNFNFLEIGKYAICIINFYLITIAFFSPELLDEKTLAQTDIVQWEGSAHRSLTLAEKHEQTPLWNDAMFGGMPNYQIAVGISDMPIPFFKYLVAGFLDLKSSAHLLFAVMFCSWVMLLCFNVNVFLSGLGGISLGLVSYHIMNITAGHFTKTWAIAYGMLVIGGLFLLYKRNWKVGIALLAVALTLEIRANHYQITYYLLFVMGLFVCLEGYFFLKAGKLRIFLQRTGILLVIGILAIATNLGRLWMTWEYAPYSTRGKAIIQSEKAKETDNSMSKEYAFQWSQGKLETLTFLIPRLFGGSSNETIDSEFSTYQAVENAYRNRQITAGQFKQFTQSIPLYWGEQPFTAGPIYAGAVICLLFILGVFFLENRLRYWLVSAFLLTLFFAWGKHWAFFNYPMFDYFPLFNKFRAVSMALYIPLLLMVLCAFITLHNLPSIVKHPKFKNRLWISLAGTGSICLLFFIFGNNIDVSNQYDGQLAPLLEEDRHRLIKSDALRSLIFITLAVVVLFISSQKKAFQKYAAIGLGVLSILDLATLDKNYLNKDSFQKKSDVKQYFAKTPADEKILKDKGQYRVLNATNPINQTYTSYHHRAVGGYSAAKLQRYQDFIEYVFTPEVNLLKRAIGGSPSAGAQMPSALYGLNMLNTKYIIMGRQAEQVLENPYALGDAWFVREIKEVKSPLEELETLSSTDLGKTALFYSENQKLPNMRYEVDSLAHIDLLEYTPNRLVYRSENRNQGFAVFSEIHYPKGWVAKLDGNQIPIQRVNYLLRALEIPAGSHEITFEFVPSSYFIGAKVSQASAVLVFLVVIGALIWSYQSLYQVGERKLSIAFPMK